MPSDVAAKFGATLGLSPGLDGPPAVLPSFETLQDARDVLVRPPRLDAPSSRVELVARHPVDSLVAFCRTQFLAKRSQSSGFVSRLEGGKEALRC